MNYSSFSAVTLNLEFPITEIDYTNPVKVSLSYDGMLKNRYSRIMNTVVRATEDYIIWDFRTQRVTKVLVKRVNSNGSLYLVLQEMINVHPTKGVSTLSRELADYENWTQIHPGFIYLSRVIDRKAFVDSLWCKGEYNTQFHYEIENKFFEVLMCVY